MLGFLSTCLVALTDCHDHNTKAHEPACTPINMDGQGVTRSIAIEQKYLGVNRFRL